MTLFYGLLLFIWLTPENDSVGVAVVLGGALAVLVVLWGVRSWAAERAVPARYLPAAGVLAGAVSGVGSALAAGGLMFFKNALHAHAFWDYPPLLIAGVLERAPAWGMAGGLVGLGLAFIWVWQHSRPKVDIQEG
ncbi:MAG: hypothetical protein IT321_21275 [Anaerolineae bacterium]|nr:hypothetical protein [Anaerolineae bacterium]